MDDTYINQNKPDDTYINLSSNIIKTFISDIFFLYVSLSLLLNNNYNRYLGIICMIYMLFF